MIERYWGLKAREEVFANINSNGRRSPTCLDFTDFVMRVLRRTFDNIDYDGNGLVDYEEFYVLLDSFAKDLGVSKRELFDQIKRKSDAGGKISGGLTRNGFFAFVVEELLRDARRDHFRPAMQRIIELSVPNARGAPMPKAPSPRDNNRGDPLRFSDSLRLTTGATTSATSQPAEDPLHSEGRSHDSRLIDPLRNDARHDKSPAVAGDKGSEVFAFEDSTFAFESESKERQKGEKKEEKKDEVFAFEADNKGDFNKTATSAMTFDSDVSFFDD